MLTTSRLVSSFLSSLVLLASFCEPPVLPALDDEPAPRVGNAGGGSEEPLKPQGPQSPGNASRDDQGDSNHNPPPLEPTWATLMACIQEKRYDDFVRQFPVFAATCTEPMDLVLPVMNLPAAVSFATLERRGLGLARTREELSAAALDSLDLVVARFPRHDAAAESMYAAAGLLIMSSREPEALALCERLVAAHKTSHAAERARGLLWTRRVLEVGKRWPGGAFIDIMGQSLDPGEKRGRPVVLYFWTASCGPCVWEIGQLKELNLRYPNRVELVGVNCDKSIEVRDAALARLTPPGRQVHLHSQAEGRRVPVASFPRNIVIGPDGLVVNKTASFEQVRALFKE